MAYQPIDLIFVIVHACNLIICILLQVNNIMQLFTVYMESLFMYYYGDVYRWISILEGLTETLQDLRQKYILKRLLEGELQCQVCGCMMFMY